MSTKIKFNILFSLLIMSVSINAYSPEIEDVAATPEPLANYDEIDLFAEFPGGDNEMYKFIKTNLHYPPSAKESGIQGRVTCRFIIEKDGTISNIKVVRSLHTLLDKEAVRVIESMPKWTPAKRNGEPVRVVFCIPITFK